MDDETDARLRMERLSNKKRKRFREDIRKLRRKKVTKPNLINPVTTPRYDTVYEQGVAWLEELAGSPQFDAGEITARILGFICINK